MSFHNSYFAGAQDSGKFKSFISFLHKFNKADKKEEFESSMQELMAAVNPDVPFARAKIEDKRVVIYPKNDKGQETDRIIFA
jgi:hypothetical protein